MKKGIISYVLTITIILGLALLVIIGLARVSEKKLQSLNEKYMTLYQKGEKGVSSPWYRKGLHVVDEGFIEEIERLGKEDKKVYALGSSMSIISCKSQPVEINGDYKYGFLVCGNGSYRSDYQLYNLYKASGIQNSEDIIKLEISFSTFREVELTIADSTLGKWGKYSVDGLEVKKNPRFLAPVYFVNKQLLKIQNVWELSYDRTHGKKIPGNFINNYFSYDAVANSCDMNLDIQNNVLKLVEDISGENRVIVELSPLPNGLAKTEFGENMEAFINETLVSKLKAQNIQYLDYRYDYADVDFCDGVHLSYDAADRYRDRLQTDLNRFIGEN